MGIQTEYMSFNNRWTICSSYDFQAHQQWSQRGFCFSQAALQWFEVLPDLSPAQPDLTLAPPGAPRHVIGTPRCSQEHPKFSTALWSVPKHITITQMVLLLQSSEIPVTLKAGRNALLGSDTLLKLTQLSLHSTSSQTLLESSSD